MYLRTCPTTSCMSAHFLFENALYHVKSFGSMLHICMVIWNYTIYKNLCLFNALFQKINLVCQSIRIYHIYRYVTENPAFVYYLYIIRNFEKIHMYDVSKYFNIIHSGFFFSILMILDYTFNLQNCLLKSCCT